MKALPASEFEQAVVPVPMNLRVHFRVILALGTGRLSGTLVGPADLSEHGYISTWRDSLKAIADPTNRFPQPCSLTITKYKP